MNLEERVSHMERRLRHYRMALVAMVLALVGVALVGATGDKDAVFYTVTAHEVVIKNRAR